MISLICPRCGGDVTTVQRREKTRGPVPCLVELLGVMAFLGCLAVFPGADGLVLGAIVGGGLLLLGHSSAYRQVKHHTCSQCGSTLASG
jgi:ribosomal protein S27AE